MRSLYLAIAVTSLLTIACGGQTPQAENPTQDAATPGQDGAESQTAAETKAAQPDVVGGEATKTGADPSDSKLSSQDKLDINAIIKQHRETLTDCFDTALANRTLPLDGFVVKAKFTIEADGRVSGAQVVEATERFEEAERCFLIGLATIAFPAPPEGRVIEAVYPFTIKRKAQ